jgi:Histidine kinase/7TM diverse intracellular signalling
MHRSALFFRIALSLAMTIAAATFAAAQVPSEKVERAQFSVDINSRDVTLIDSWKLKFGDDAAWALPQTSDAEWVIADEPGAFWIENGMPGNGIGWYRARILILSQPDSLNPINMHIVHYPTAQEIYWDGNLIATNGRIGRTVEEERAGKVFQAVRLSHRLTEPGVHVLAIRVSNYWNASGGLGDVKLGAWKPLQNDFHGQWALLIFQVGIISVTGVYFFANFLTRINRTYALFSLICLGCVLQTVPRYVEVYSNVGIEATRWLSSLQYLGYTIMMCSFPLFFFSEFSSLARKWYWVTAAIAGLATLPCQGFIFNLIPTSLFQFVKVSNAIIGFAAIFASLGVTGWAVYRKKENSLMASLGLLCMLVGVTVGAVFELQFTWPLGLTALILFLNAGLSRSLTRKSMAYQEAHLKGARLEIELLKKNIQPHFLLTSLRSITDWLEKEPKMAARLVNALATELRMMLKMTTERMVSMNEEINLCRTHLEVMGLRRHRTLALDTRGVDGEELIPPMVMHTLLEIGLDEASEGNDEIRFLLERIQGNGLILRLSHQAALKPRWQRGEDETGLKYMRARLQECFPGRWSLLAGLSDTSWVAEIRINDPAALPCAALPGHKSTIQGP